MQEILSINQWRSNYVWITSYKELVVNAENITLSSGEAELVAAVKMGTELIGITQLAEDWGLQTSGKIYVDSSAAIGVA